MRRGGDARKISAAAGLEPAAFHGGPQRMLTVSAIGSCRVFTPLNLVRRRKEILTGHASAEWYTHSTKDVLQKIDIG
ncbi:hypothetical protein GCM10010994_09410 [Chelatococcus reniformis]|uniref:Uncharacterized protein n=1 Tax=Chelatococcus reniformis TaxID=1494448 RepID=A0A916X7Q1_9HYPH|nr:hypothetical protein GCM10010994_09410 [Chelatococcus reniformis]